MLLLPEPELTKRCNLAVKFFVLPFELRRDGGKKSSVELGPRSHLFAIVASALLALLRA